MQINVVFLLNWIPVVLSISSMSNSSLKPRLLQMMLSTQSGGAETFFEKLSLAFAQCGIPQCLVVEPNEARAELFRKYPCVKVVEIHFGGLRELRAQRELRHAFENFSPDVALTWMNRASRRVPSGHCPVVGRLGGYYKLKHYTNCNHLVGITPDLVEHIVSGGRSRGDVSLIPNFGETADLLTEEDGASLRRELAIPEDHMLLLGLGRLHKVKAHDILIEAMSRVESTSLLLAGEGPLRAQLQAQVEQLGLTNRVHFLGWRRDVARLFAACEISVFPSRYEPNGTVVMESWAHGKPLIASRAKGPEWLVDDGENGLLFDIDSVDQLVDRIRLLQSDADLRARLVAGGLEKWQRAFSREAVVEQYLEVFGSLIRSSPS